MGVKPGRQTEEKLEYLPETLQNRERDRQADTDRERDRERTQNKTKMNKRKYSQLEAGDGWRDRKLAEAMCQSKLKRLSTSTLYKTVLVKNTLKFVRNSPEENIL